MKKKLLGLVLASSMVVTMMTGCGSNATNEAAKSSETQETEASKETTTEETAATPQESDLLAQIKERGYVTVAMEGTWAPWTYHDEADNLVGFDVEVAKAVADKLGVEVKYEEGEWDGLLAGVQGGRYDIMVNGVGYTEERAQAYNFSTPYAYNKTVLIVRSDNEDVKTLEDLAGKTTCNSANSTYQLIAEEYGATVLDVETLDGTLEMVLAGTSRADATLNAEVSFNDYMTEHPDAELRVAAYAPDVEQVCIITQKGDNSESLVEAINTALAELSADGTLGAISTKYFGLDITNP